MDARGILPVGAKERSFVLRLMAFFVIITLLLFVPAGRTFWLRGWFFLLLNLILIAASIFYMASANPEIFEARRRLEKGTKRWDKILLAFLSVAFAAILVVAALDDGRFGWSPQPWWVVVVGYALYTISFVLVAWAQTVNRFFELGVRIQTDRGHHVIDCGPYAFIRHPGYLAVILIAAGTALSLGSLWALLPAGVTSAIMILRTVLEDRTLQNELAGYNEYTQKVRFRLLPGVW